MRDHRLGRTERKRGSARNASNPETGGYRSVFDIRFLIASVVISILDAIVTMILYGKTAGQIPGPFMFAIVMGVFYCIWAIGIILYSMLDSRYGRIKTYEKKSRNPVVETLKFLVIIMLVSMTFEFIYELEPQRKAIRPTSYVFLMDDSGSMEGNDGDFLRYQAIRPIMENEEKGFPFAIYSFSNDLIEIAPMHPREEQVKDYMMPSGRDMSGTAMFTSIETIVEEIQKGNIDGGEHTRIILMSDGSPTDDGIFGKSVSGVLENCVDSGISISTVGLGNGVNKSLMEEIARTTGGVYVQVKDIDQLQSGMEEAAVKSSSRDLLSMRNFSRITALLVFERIVFMGILAFIIGASALFISEFHPERYTFYWAIGKSLAAGILIELLIQLFHAPGLGNVLYFILAGVILAKAMERIRRRRNEEGTVQNVEDSHGSPATGEANNLKEAKKKNPDEVKRLDYSGRK